MHLFSAVIEVLVRITQENNKGAVNRIQVKLSQFSDDMVSYFKDPKNRPGVVGHTFKSSTWEAETSRSC